MPKQLRAVDGRSPLERCVALFVAHPAISELVIALPDEFVAEPPPFLTGAPKAIRVVSGGRRRQDSVANAFEAVNARADVILIHDAARPFASQALVTSTIDAAAESGAAVAALRSRDTVKRSDGGNAVPSFVVETLPRDTIYLAQTPQAFRRAVLRDALALSEAGADATDEASLAERAGHRVRLVDGEPTNIKITTPEDLAVADSIARGVAAPVFEQRVGTGYDLHRLVKGRPLALGGVIIAAEHGPLAHSDGDVACHAVTDAILGAASLGDIGQMFPDSDPEWKDAASLHLLRGAVDRVREHGFEVVNVDITVILERPKVRGYVDAMRKAIGGAIGIGAAQVSIKGKTNEGVDAVGRGEAIAAHAVALLRRPV